MRAKYGAIASVITLIMSGHATAQEMACGTLQNAYGPYDYTNAGDVRERLPIVDNIHFTPQVEALVAGSGTGSVPLDLDYVLRAFPNHHRALYAMARYQIDNSRPPQAKYMSADCYFTRALMFKPDDGRVHLVHGIYLQRVGRPNEARTAYMQALALMPDSAEAHYNLGLLFVQQKQYDDALVHAHQAYAAGYPLPGLRNQLSRAGRWRAPAPPQ